MSPGASIEPLLATKEILVFCGSGGVGKTSVAASAGLAAATHMDGKVLVVTVDPAKRLADALGIEGIGNVERRVPPEEPEEPHGPDKHADHLRDDSEGSERDDRVVSHCSPSSIAHATVLSSAGLR